MIINEIKTGGMRLTITGEECAHLAKLFDHAAGLAQEDGDEPTTWALEGMSAMFSAAAVACKAQDFTVDSKAIWMSRENAEPTFHVPQIE